MPSPRLRADDLGLEQIEGLAKVVLMEVANRRATWGRFNLHAETMRQIMGFRFTTTDHRIRLLDQIAYSSQYILDAERRLLAHSQRTGGTALMARLVARHTSRKISGVRLDPDQVVAITRIAHSG